MEADGAAVWIPFHTCSNQTQVAEAVSSFVMALKELDESTSSDLESRTTCRGDVNAVLRHTICDLHVAVCRFTQMQ